MDNETGKNKILLFVEKHPYALITLVIALVVIIIFMYLGISAPSCLSMKKKKIKDQLSDDDEYDELIDSIHEKQKKKHV